MHGWAWPCCSHIFTYTREAMARLACGLLLATPPPICSLEGSGSRPGTSLKTTNVERGSLPKRGSQNNHKSRRQTYFHSSVWLSLKNTNLSLFLNVANISPGGSSSGFFLNGSHEGHQSWSPLVVLGLPSSERASGVQSAWGIKVCVCVCCIIYNHYWANDFFFLPLWESQGPLGWLLSPFGAWSLF